VGSVQNDHKAGCGRSGSRRGLLRKDKLRGCRKCRAGPNHPSRPVTGGGNGSNFWPYRQKHTSEAKAPLILLAQCWDLSPGPPVFGSSGVLRPAFTATTPRVP
jgi:hypothetical protein